MGFYLNKMFLTNCLRLFSSASAGSTLLRSPVFQKQVTSATSVLDNNLFGFSILPARFNQRGHDYKGNMRKRIKQHGKQTRMKSINGKITLMKRMMKGVPNRKLTVG